MSDEPKGGRAQLREVPVGLEKVLYTAAIDPAFREELLRDREAATRARGFELQGSELTMLRLAPEAQLASAIAALDTSEASLARRGFMRAVAGAVTLAAGSVLAGCGEETTQGIRPELDSGGIRPGDFGYEGATRGIQPDLPRIDGMPSAGVRADDAALRDDAKKPDGK